MGNTGLFDDVYRVGRIVESDNILNLHNITRSSELRKNIKKSKNVKHIVCHRDNNICFILTDTKTIAMTKSGAFLLEPLVIPGDLWRRRLMKIRRLILSRNISNYNDLVGWCRPGITMTFVSLDWYV